jgi:uncharacterized protein DUF6069
MLRAMLFSALAIALAFGIDLAIGRAGVGLASVPKDFPPFTALPILSGAAGGIVLASIGYAIAQAVSNRPERTFLLIAAVALVLSFGLPLRLSFTKSPRFAGVTPTAQMLLVLMHCVVATIDVAAVLAMHREPVPERLPQMQAG